VIKPIALFDLLGLSPVAPQENWRVIAGHFVLIAAVLW
jgi:hypothetical protein